MSSFLREFARSLHTPGQPPTSAGGTSTPAPNTQPQTPATPQPGGAGNTPAQPADASDYDGLAFDTDESAPWIEDKEGKRFTGFPKPNVEVNFCCQFANNGKVRSDGFYIEFQLTGGHNWKSSYHAPNGMKAARSVVFRVPYEGFTDDEELSYELRACAFTIEGRELVCSDTLMFLVRP